jgi:4-methyl-5(b-hydroxyethyl)-thiazole monophosphate biosynthesis
MKKAVVFLADGFEEVEAVTPIDFLRRAGVEVCAVSLNERKTAIGSHHIPISADMSLSELREDGWDAVILPGGMPGAANLAACEKVRAFVNAMAEKKGLIAAICASPAVALYPFGVLNGRRFTCYPGLEEKVKGAQWVSDAVVIDGNIITSRGPGTAALWATAIISYLMGKEAARKIALDTLNDPNFA